VLVDRLVGETRLPAEKFAIDTLVVGPLFEGHRTLQAEGSWATRPDDTRFGAGWALVRTRQPLGVLAAYLLEPASEDGVVTWNLLDRELVVGGTYPILRVRRLPPVPTIAVP
jgi:dipeptidyl-peptidase-4